MKIKSFLFIMVVFLFAGCNNLEYFEINSVKEPLIVLNARLVARQSPRVYVGKIWGATEISPRETYYQNADVELFEEGKSVGKLILKDTLYIKQDYIIKADTKYVIKVSVQGVKNIESEPVLIPSDIQILKLEYDVNTVIRSSTNYTRLPCLVKFSFQKNDAIISYGIDIRGYNKDGEQLRCAYDNLELGRRTVVKSPCSYSTDIPEVDLVGNIGKFNFGKNAYISKCLDDSEKEISLIADLYGNGYADAVKGTPFPTNTKINQMVVCLTTISNEGLELFKTIKPVEGVSAALLEPYPTYNNIKGGLGIVIGYNVTYRVITIK